MKYVWIIWALKPGRSDIVAITDNEHKDHYEKEGEILYIDATIKSEKVMINHLFGAKDLLGSRVQKFR